jgi:hypothetical protein
VPLSLRKGEEVEKSKVWFEEEKKIYFLIINNMTSKVGSMGGSMMGVKCVFFKRK